MSSYIIMSLVLHPRNACYMPLTANGLLTLWIPSDQVMDPNKSPFTDALVAEKITW